MALLANESTIFEDFSNRPMLLKDFLTQDYSCTTCKSTDSSKSNQLPPAIALLRSWSKKASATKLSAIQKIINVVKLLQRSSRKSSKGKNDISGGGVILSEDTVKVKDILRLRSFRDTVDDQSTPLGSPSSPDRTITTGSSCSKRSSWCDSDFTAEDLPFWGGEKCFSAALLRNTKVDWSIGECEQQSPVSILDISPFHPSLDDFESTLTRRIRDIDGITKSKQTRTWSLSGEIIFPKQGNDIEEKAKRLLSHVKQDRQLNKDSDHMNTMMYDFFKHELSIRKRLYDFEFDDQILRVAKSWCNGEIDNESYEWDVKDKREAYVKDMEKEVCWDKFKEEQEDISMELEVKVLDELIDEFLVDFLTK